MEFPFAAVGDVVGAGLSFIGGQQQMAQQNAQFNTSRVLAEQQLAFQQAAAQNGIRWRVSDAKAAGVSPLVALGAPTFNPGAIGVAPTAGGNPYEGAAAHLGKLGQDVSAAVGRTQTAEERFDAFMNFQIKQAQINKLNADTEVSKASAASIASRMPNNPPFPSVGGSGGLAGQTVDRGFGVARETIPKIETAGPNPGTAAGAEPNSMWKRTGEFTVVRVPRDPVIASASPWNPEYIKWQMGTFHERPPPMEALPPGTVRWIPGPLNQWRAVPYWPGERGFR